MKKLLLLTAAFCVLCQQQADAWGRLGHQVVIKVAERHLTDKAKRNIARYMPYDLKTDAVWMDQHRRDKGIDYTTAWHVYNVDKNHEYNPNARLKQGDAIRALQIADYNLARYRELNDSTVVMNLRMLLHFVGDMHCPTHSYFPGPRCFWECTLNGKPQKSFHSVYDKMPELIYGDMSAEEVAERIDTCKRRDIKKIQSGSLYDWVRDCADNNAVIYRWNPFNTETLDPNTVELSHELVDIQMRNAGYRLAYLLNEYFGE